MTRFRDDPELWVAILTGAGGRAFCRDATESRPANPWAPGIIGSSSDRS